MALHYLKCNICCNVVRLISFEKLTTLSKYWVAFSFLLNKIVGLKEKLLLQIPFLSINTEQESFKANQ